MDPVIRREDHELDLTQTVPRFEHRFQWTKSNVSFVELLGYEIRGVPMAGAGTPVDHSYYLQLGNAMMPQRLVTTANATGDAYPLRLTGEISRQWFDTCRPILALANNRPLSSLIVELKRPNGDPAILDQVTLYLRIGFNYQDVTMDYIIRTKPGALDSYEAARNGLYR